MWLNSPDNKTPFLSQFAPDATLKPQMYSLVVQFILLHFRPDSDSSLQEVKEANSYPRMPSYGPIGSSQHTIEPQNRHGVMYSLLQQSLPMPM